MMTATAEWPMITIPSDSSSDRLTANTEANLSLGGSDYHYWQLMPLCCYFRHLVFDFAVHYFRQRAADC